MYLCWLSVIFDQIEITLLILGKKCKTIIHQKLHYQNNCIELKMKIILSGQFF